MEYSLPSSIGARMCSPDVRNINSPVVERNPAPVEFGSLSHYLPGFQKHLRWLALGFQPSTVSRFSHPTRMVVKVRAIRKLWLGELSCAGLLGDPPVYGFLEILSNIWLLTVLLAVPFWVCSKSPVPGNTWVLFSLY